MTVILPILKTSIRIDYANGEPGNLTKYGMREWIDLFEGISDIIIREVVKTGQQPEDINDGYCYFFAHRVVKTLGEGAIVADPSEQLTMERNDLTYDPTAPKHCFIIYDGKVYDSETPNGVDRWQDLPFYLRATW